MIVPLSQASSTSKRVVSKVLGVNDDITYFQFSKKNNRESGPAVVGIEVKNPNDFKAIEEQLTAMKFNYQYLNENVDLFTHLIL